MGKKAKKRAKRAAAAAAEMGSRSYEAGYSTPQRRTPVGAELSQDAAAMRAYPNLREWGRYLDENHDLVVGILDDLIKNTVGTGIVTIPKPLRRDGSVDEQLGASLITRWKRWMRRADVTGELHWNEAQRQIARAWLRDGEEFLQHVTSRDGEYPFAPDDTPYRIELFESDMVPHDLNDPDTGWRQGIQTDRWRRPLRYAVYASHPGDVGYGYGRPVDLSEVTQIEAYRISHIKAVKRWPALRGVSVLHPVITRLWDYKDLEESERIKNRVLASWTAAIKKSPDVPGWEPYSQESGTRYLEMAGGTVIDTLAPGEEITGVGPEYPNNGINDYLNDQLRRVAAGTGTRHSAIAKRYDGNYAAQRQEMVESAAGYQIREDLFVEKICREVYERWLLAELGEGAVRVPGDFDRLANAEYRGPITPWIDPLKEVQADALAVAEGFASIDQIRIKRGAPAEMIGQPAPTAPERPRLSAVPDDDDEVAA